MSDLTHVELLWLEKRIENRIRFGRSVEERILDRNRRVLSFAAGSVFAFVRWISNDFGAAASRIDILRAVATGQRCSTVPYVKPGGEILLRLSGWPKVERVLQLIDAVEALGIDPAAIDALVLSHGHQDHFGGLVGFLLAHSGKLKPKLPLFVGGEGCFCAREWTAPPVRGSFGVIDRKALEEADIVDSLSQRAFRGEL